MKDPYYYRMNEKKDDLLNRERIERYVDKLEHFGMLMDKIEEWMDGLDQESFLSLDLIKRFGIYHAAQTSIENMTDIIAMVIKDIKIKPKDDYSNIDCLEEKGLISEGLAAGLRKLNGLRNVFVHEYNGVDDLLAYSSIIQHFDYLKQFKEVIKAWLKKNS